MHMRHTRIIICKLKVPTMKTHGRRNDTRRNKTLTTSDAILTNRDQTSYYNNH